MGDRRVPACRERPQHGRTPRGRPPDRRHRESPQSGDDPAHRQGFVERPFQRPRVDVPGDVEQRSRRRRHRQALVDPDIAAHQVAAAVERDAGATATGPETCNGDLDRPFGQVHDSPCRGGGDVTEERPIPAREQCRRFAGEWQRGGVDDGIDTDVLGNQQALARHATDGARTHTGGQQLSTRHASPLDLRDRARALNRTAGYGQKSSQPQHLDSAGRILSGWREVFIRAGSPPRVGMIFARARVAHAAKVTPQSAKNGAGGPLSTKS